MEKQEIPPERWVEIEAWFDRAMKDQAERAAELAGWLAPGFDPDGTYEMVAIDRVHHLAVYIRKDGTREVKPIPDFLDDWMTPPPDTRPKPAPKPRFGFIRTHLALLN